MNTIVAVNYFEHILKTSLVKLFSYLFNCEGLPVF